jgi:hypothetical protein
MLPAMANGPETANGPEARLTCAWKTQWRTSPHYFDPTQCDTMTIAQPWHCQKVPESTARDYHAKIVYSDLTELVPHSVQTSSSSATVPRKPDNRHIMERSLISAIAYALIVSVTHAVPADEENCPKEDECTPGAWEWAQKVREANPEIKMRMLSHLTK